ncbi:MAG: MFS transporter [Promethearchaeota archaeon]
MSENEIKYSTKIRSSYGIGGFLDNFVLAAFTTRIIFFYENEVLLSITLVGLAMVLYGLWNMINDPLIGYLSDKSTFFVKKGWGRRFPWYAIGVLVYMWIYLLVFMVPTNDEIGMFFWLLITIIIFEGAFTLWQANYLALFPDKFRSQKERTNVGTWNTIWGVIGIALGVLIPPLLIEYGQPETYILATMVVAIMAFVLALLSLPGVKEDEELKQRELKIAESGEESISFISVLKIALKDRNFMAYTITYFGHQVMTVFLLSSLTYWNVYIIGSADPDVETILSALFLIFVLAIGVPLWAYVGKKVGNQKAFQYGTIISTVLFIPLFFASDLITSALFIALIGVGIGCIWVLMYPCFSDVIDNIVVKTGQRQEGVLTGIRTFFGRAPIILQGVTFAIIHTATGYIAGAPPGSSSQPALAQLGIRFHMVIIPMIFYFIGFIMMMFVYKLNTRTVEENKKILAERLL